MRARVGDSSEFLFDTGRREVKGVSRHAVWKWLHGDEPLAVTAEGVIARLKRAKVEK